MKQVKGLLGGKECSVWVDTQADSERQSHPLWQFKSLLFWVSFGRSCWFAGSESVFGISQEPPTCASISLSQDGFDWRGPWVVSIAYYGVPPPPFLTSKEPFCPWVVGEFSCLQEWELHGVLSSFWAGLSLLLPQSCCVCLGICNHVKELQLFPPGGSSVSSLKSRNEYIL